MTALNHTRILIVEDERPVRMLLRVVLEAAGATVLEAENGRQALRLLEVEPMGFDMVLTDLNMPEVDGEQLVQAIRAQWGDNTPIVMCTAMNIAVRSPMLLNLVQGVVTKPFSPPELVRAVAQAVAGHARERRAAV